MYCLPAGMSRPAHGGIEDLESALGGIDVGGEWVFTLYNHGPDRFVGHFDATLAFDSQADRKSVV